MQDMNLNQANKSTALLETSSSQNKLYQPKFFKTANLLQAINNITLTVDGIIGVTASARDDFDKYIQRSESLYSLVPVYMATVIFLPLMYICCRSKLGWQALQMRPEDILVEQEAADGLRGKYFHTKNTRLDIDVKTTLITHIPTFMLNLGLHLAYTIALSMAQKQSDNWFVQNYDWLGPSLILAMMATFTLGSEYGYRSIREKKLKPC